MQYLVYGIGFAANATRFGGHRGTRSLGGVLKRVGSLGKDDAMNDLVLHSTGNGKGAAAQKPAAALKIQTAPTALSHEIIAQRAYEIYLQKGCPQNESEQ
ncbi:MAG TPA: hypothetical protein VL860_01075, partial [Planctomycetota bacterium]|nr:hypothetical protein [Planctomycetota bacterium]